MGVAPLRIPELLLGTELRTELGTEPASELARE